MNYKEFFVNLIKEQYPEKLNDPRIQWKLDHLDTSINVLELNNLIFENKDKQSKLVDSRLRSYKESDIIRILRYQAKYNKSNADIVAKFGMTRTTLCTWKRRFENLLFDSKL